MKIALLMTLSLLGAPDAGPSAAASADEVPAAEQPPAPTEAKPTTAPTAGTTSPTTGAPKAQKPSLSEVAARIKPSVVNIQLLDATGEVVSQGTGFFVARDDVVATNFHVIEGASEVRVTLADGRVFDAVGVVAEREDRDLALVKLKQETGAPWLELGKTEGLVQGTEVVVIGNPTGLAGTLSSGVVSALRESGLDGETAGVFSGRLVQITAPISPGSSGSPVVTWDGQVVGVAVGQRAFGQNLNFIVPVEDLSNLVKQADLLKVARPFGSGASTNLLLSLGFFALLAVVFVVLTRKKAPQAKKRPVH